MSSEHPSTSTPGSAVRALSPERITGALAACLDLPARCAAMAAELVALRADVAAIAALLPPVLATVPDAARVMQVSPSTIRRAIRRGEIPIVRVGRSVRVDLTALRAVDAEHIARLARDTRTASGHARTSRHEGRVRG